MSIYQPSANSVLNPAFSRPPPNSVLADPGQPPANSVTGNPISDAFAQMLAARIPTTPPRIGVEALEQSDDG